MCLAVDVLFALITVILTKVEDESFAWISMLFILTIYFYTDIWLLFYNIQFRFKMPVDLQGSMFKAIFGFGDELCKQLNGELPYTTNHT